MVRVGVGKAEGKEVIIEIPKEVDPKLFVALFLFALISFSSHYLPTIIYSEVISSLTYLSWRKRVWRGWER